MRRAHPITEQPARVIGWICALAAALVGAGCQSPRIPETTTAADAGDSAFEDVWSAALAVLRQAGFQPDRQDRVARMIVTLPETSAQWFEFWRGDVADPHGLFESSMQTVQRKVTVRLERPKNDAPWRVDVRADVYRLSRPERQVTTASSAFNIFSARLPLADDDPADFDSGSGGLTPLGRDGALEQDLLVRIMAASSTPIEPAPTEAPTANSPVNSKIELEERPGAAIPAE